MLERVSDQCGAILSAALRLTWRKKPSARDSVYSRRTRLPITRLAPDLGSARSALADGDLRDRVDASGTRLRSDFTSIHPPRQEQPPHRGKWYFASQPSNLLNQATPHHRLRNPNAHRIPQPQIRAIRANSRVPLIQLRELDAVLILNLGTTVAALHRMKLATIVRDAGLRRRRRSSCRAGRSRRRGVDAVGVPVAVLAVLWWRGWTWGRGGRALARGFGNSNRLFLS